MTSRIAMMGGLMFGALLLQTVVAPTFSVGGWRADLLLVTVVGFALADGAETGARYGFAAGLAADLLSGGGHLVGLSALVFLLIGDALGRARPYLSGTERIGEAALGALAGAVAFGMSGALALLLDVRQLGGATLIQGVLATALWTALLSVVLCRPIAALSQRFSGDLTAGATGPTKRAW